MKPEGFAVLTLSPALDTFLSQFTPTYYTCMAELDRKILCMSINFIFSQTYQHINLTFNDELITLLLVGVALLLCNNILNMQ